MEISREFKIHSETEGKLWAELDRGRTVGGARQRKEWWAELF